MSLVSRLIIPILGICCFLILILIPGCDSPKTSIDFNATLEHIDSLLASGAIREAATALSSAEKEAKQRDEWLRILKRRYSAASSSGNWEAFTESARVAFERYPGATDFAGLYAYGSLRSGNSEKADVIEREYLDERSWKPLSDEIWLVARASRTDEADRRFALPAYYSKELDEDDATLLLQAGERFDDSRFYVDAALIFAGMGEYNRALDALRIHESSLPLFSALIHYDTGNLDRAYTSVSPLLRDVSVAAKAIPSDDLLTLADIATASGDVQLASQIYEAYIAADHANSWIPYANLAQYLRDEGAFREAIELVEMAFAHGIAHKALDVERILTVIEAEDFATAAAHLAEMESRYPVAYEIPVLYYLMENTRGKEQRALAAVKEVFYGNPRYEQTAFLAIKLLANAGDLEGVRIILDEYLSVASENEWTDFFSGYCALAEGELETALQSFTNAAERINRWYHYYNKGLILAGLGAYEDARAEFRRATAFTTDTMVRARFVLDIARTFAFEGDIISARREATYASELSPALTDAKLFLKELDAKTRSAQ